MLEKIVEGIFDFLEGGKLLEKGLYKEREDYYKGVIESMNAARVSVWYSSRDYHTDNMYIRQHKGKGKEALEFAAGRVEEIMGKPLNEVHFYAEVRQRKDGRKRLTLSSGNGNKTGWYGLNVHFMEMK